MFAPTKTWRKWHVKLNQSQKRYATVSALAASAIPALVLARGHRIERIAEVPLVVGNGIESITKTRAAVELLKSLNAYRDVVKVSNSRKLRAGKGKLRNRRHRQRRGPLIVYREDNGITRAFRNVPGVELANVRRLNLLQLAPGGHLGRFIIWTQSAFEMLDKIFGTYRKTSALKRDYNLPSHSMSNPDLMRLLQSDEIRSVLKTAGPSRTKRAPGQKKNPLRNTQAMLRLNPYAQAFRRQEILGREKAAALKAAGKIQPKKKSGKRATAKFLQFMLSK
jgi:large subunit ribosomal protein L4e